MLVFVFVVIVVVMVVMMFVLRFFEQTFKKFVVTALIRLKRIKHLFGVEFAYGRGNHGNVGVKFANNFQSVVYLAFGKFFGF